MSRRGSNYGGRGGNDGLGVIVVGLFFIIVAIPFVGLWLMISGKSLATKVIGTILLIVGIIIWTFFGTAK